MECAWVCGAKVTLEMLPQVGIIFHLSFLEVGQV